MIYVLLPRLKNKKQEIWTIQTHERAIVFTNKTNGDVDAYFGRAYLNDYRIGVSHDGSKDIASGKKGINVSMIKDEDLDENTKGFEQIEGEFAVANSADEELFIRPVIIDRAIFVAESYYPQ